MADTAEANMLRVLEAAPPGAALTRTELVAAAGKSPETARIRLAAMVKAGIVERCPTDYGDVFRLVQRMPVRTARVEPATDAQDLVDELRAAYEARMKAEVRVQELEKLVRERLTGNA